MSARWLRAILVVAFCAGVFGIGVWRVAAHRSDQVIDTGLGPVFVVTGSKQPGSCEDVSIRRSSVGLFAAAASIDGYDVTVKVVDGLYSENTFATPYASVTRNEPGMLRLVVTASGEVESQRKSYANEVLHHATLDRVGDPTSLTVDWPRGFKQQASGIPWRVSGEIMDRPYRYVPDVDSRDPTRFQFDASVNDDRSVRLLWTKVEPLTGPGVEWGYWIGMSPSEFKTGVNNAIKTEVKTANKVIDGYLVSVFTEGVTQAEVDTLVHEVHPISLQCPVETTDATRPDRALRVYGQGWVSYVDNANADSQNCNLDVAVRTATAHQTLDHERMRCGSPIIGASAFGSDGADAPQVAIVVDRAVRKVRLTNSHGSSAGIDATVAVSKDSPVGVAVVNQPVSARDPLVIEALDATGAIVQRSSLDLGCHYTEPCSALNDLLSQPPVSLAKQEPNLVPTLYFGQVQMPQISWPYSHLANVGPVEWASTVPTWCGLLDVTETGYEHPNRNGASACIAVNELNSTTLTVNVEALDEIGVTEAVGVVGSDITSVKVVAGTSSTMITVQRLAPGPGAIAFAYPYFGTDENSKVICEGLDSSGKVVATWSSKHP